MAAISSLPFVTRRSSTRVTTSFGRTPAWSAGPPGSTSPITAPFVARPRTASPTPSTARVARPVRSSSSATRFAWLIGMEKPTPIALGNSDSARVGQQVVAFGAPLGLGGSVTAGIVSALDRAVSVGEASGASEATVLSALQTDAAINPGNSGGPLVDMQGRLIGINTVIATTGAEGGSIGVGFAIPVNQAKRIAEELERTGRATRAVLGVGLAGTGRAANGAVIGQVTAGGPADQAGIRPDEVVTRVDDRVVTNGNELVAAIRDHAPGDRVTLTVNGRQVAVTLGGQTS